MKLPSRYHNAFSPDTLNTLMRLGDRIAVHELVFFRSAISASVAENEKRSYTPSVLVEERRLPSARCTCSTRMFDHDLCRHIAALVATALDEQGRLIGDRFEVSLWRVAGFALFESHPEMVIEQRSDTFVVSDCGVQIARITVSPDLVSSLAGIREGAPREEYLRHMSLSKQEKFLLDCDATSSRMRWESSLSYRLMRWLFQQITTDQVRLEQRDGGWALTANGLISFEILAPLKALGAILDVDGGSIAPRSGLGIQIDGLTPSFRVDFDSDRSLRFTPVLLDESAAYDRAELDASRSGRYYWIEPRNAFMTVRDIPRLFSDETSPRQASLFDSGPSSPGGMSWGRQVLVPEREVFDFLRKHRDSLASLPLQLVDPAVRDGRPEAIADEVLYHAWPTSDTTLRLSIDLIFGSDRVSVSSIASARKERLAVLRSGAVWIDTSDPQFSWIDSLAADAILPDGSLQVTPLGYLRIRGSLSGRAVFEGDTSVLLAIDEQRASRQAPTSAEVGLALYPYQDTGYQWLWFLQQSSFGGLLCDDMGLGKTHQAMALIAAMERTMNSEPSVLIVCPTSLIDHWREKLERYTPDISFSIHHGNLRGSPSKVVTVTSYGMVRSDGAAFRGRMYDLLVLDEIQTIKNRDTQTHKAMREIRRSAALGLTGTPIENHIGELRTLLDFVMPGYLPSEAAFDRQYSIPIEAGDRGASERLHRLVQPFILRRTKSQVLDELPPKIVDKRYCVLTPEQSELYAEVIRARGVGLRDSIRQGKRFSYLHVFAALNLLKQICNHPASVAGGLATDGPSGKWSLFCELLEESLGSGLKVVVFSQYLRMLDLIEAHLREGDIGFAGIRGSTRERGAEVARFRDDPSCRVFVASLRAAGLGIDLTPGSVVIHYDRWWNQAREEQATDRVHRLGQNKGVQVLKLITRGTLEEKIDAIIEKKARLATVVRPDDPSLVKQFAPEELDELLQYEG